VEQPKNQIFDGANHTADTLRLAAEGRQELVAAGGCGGRGVGSGPVRVAPFRVGVEAGVETVRERIGGELERPMVASELRACEPKCSEKQTPRPRLHPHVDTRPAPVSIRRCHGHGWVTQRLAGLKRGFSEEIQGLALAWGFESLLRYHFSFENICLAAQGLRWWQAVRLGRLAVASYLPGDPRPTIPAANLGWRQSRME
jgi:hypothetical protein